MWTDSKEIHKSFDLNMLEKKYPDVCPVCGWCSVKITDSDFTKLSA